MKLAIEARVSAVGEAVCGAAVALVCRGPGEKAGRELGMEEGVGVPREVERGDVDGCVD